MYINFYIYIYIHTYDIYILYIFTLIYIRLYVYTLRTYPIVGPRQLILIGSRARPDRLFPICSYFPGAFSVNLRDNHFSASSLS